MTRVDTIAETELEPFMLPSIDTVAAGGSDATQKTNAHADSCIPRLFSIKRGGKMLLITKYKTKNQSSCPKAAGRSVV